MVFVFLSQTCILGCEIKKIKKKLINTNDFENKNRQKLKIL